MTLLSCLHCGAEATNGLALCDLCRRKAATDLEFIPVYFANLARWSRPARPNGSLGSRGQWLIRQGESDGNRVAAALDEAGTELVTRVLLLAEDRPIDVPEQTDDEGTMVRVLCELLTTHLTSISLCEWAGEFVRSTGLLEARLRILTEQVAPGWYAGACRRCETATHVVPGLTWVTCGGCGATTYARDHLERVLTEARGWVARPMRLAEAIVALVDTELSVPRLHKRISKWGERGQISALRLVDEDGDPVGPKRYRLGEVLDALRHEGATRTEADADVPGEVCA